MPSRNNVQNARKLELFRRLHLSLIEVVSAMNRAQNDHALLDEAGVKLDRALLPLLVGIGRLGPISVGELADRAGRDYTTVSRQLKKLSELSLIQRTSNPDDQRVSVAELTDDGRRVTRTIDGARNRLAAAALSEWSESDLDQLVSLLERFTTTLTTGPSGQGPE